MGSLSIWHWLIVLVVVLLLFGRGRLSDIMGEFGKGVQSFKKGIADADQPKIVETTTPHADAAPAPAPVRETEPRQG